MSHPKTTPCLLGRRSKELRAARKWSVPNLLERLPDGVATEGTIYKLETGHFTKPTLELAEALADAFGLSLDLLLDRDLPTSALAVALEILDARSRLVDLLASEQKDAP